MRAAIAAALCVFILADLGCVSPRYVIQPPAQNTDVEQSRMAALVAPYPAEFRISQRIILSINGKEYDFIGYLAAKRDGGYRAMAFGDMGGRVFDFAEQDGKREILSKPAGMPSGPLLDGVMGDVRHLFMVKPEGSYVASRREGGLSLILKGRNGVSEFVFADDGILASSLEVENGTPVREAVYSGYRVFRGWEKPLPSRIVVNNKCYGYQLRIDLLKIDVTPGDARLLPSPDRDQ